MSFQFFWRKVLRLIFGPPDSMQVADEMVSYAMKRGFRAFHDPAFRAHVNFTHIEMVEQDRMFNELVASNLVLMLLMTDTLRKLTTKGVQEFLGSIGTAMIEQFLKTLGEMGVSEDHVHTWRKLIELRRDEYEEDRLKARSSLPEFGEGNPWMRLVAVGCLFHIRRGAPIKDDPLLSLLVHQAADISDRTRQITLHAVQRL